MRGSVVGAAGVAAVLVLALPPRAAGDGLPVGGGDAGHTGVATHGAPDRYVTLRAGRDTLVARVRRAGGQVKTSRMLRGRFTVPAVALDASTSGLSGDGRTLALIRPRRSFPRARTTFAVLDTAGLRLRRAVALRGDYSFDALSPDGRSLYLIHYLSKRDPSRYEVRLYDLAAGLLMPEPIVDPREADERMRGLPITRAATRDGRWHYTLYDGGAGYPFIHALDTVGRTAACIDLDALSGRRDLYDLRLGLQGRRALTVLAGSEPVVAVDRATFRVRSPAETPAAVPPDPPARVPWALVAAGGLALAGAGLAARRRIVRGRAPADGTSREASLV